TKYGVDPRSGRFEKTSGVDLPPSLEEKKFLDKVGIPSEKQAEVLKTIRDNPLAKPEIMEGFAAKIREATVNWTDITPLAEKADKAEKALKEANKAYYSTLGKDSALRGVDLDNVADVRKAVAGDPEKLRLVDELERARIARDESKRALNQALEPRMAE